MQATYTLSNNTSLVEAYINNTSSLTPLLAGVNTYNLIVPVGYNFTLQVTNTDAFNTHTIKFFFKLLYGPTPANTTTSSNVTTTVASNETITSSPGTEQKRSMPTYVIVIIGVLCGLAIIILTLLLLYFCLRKRVQGTEQAEDKRPSKGDGVNVISTEKGANVFQSYYTNTEDKYTTGIKIP